jgi:hypothetical protein
MSGRSVSFSKPRKAAVGLAGCLFTLLLAPALHAQPAEILTAAPAERLSIQRGAEAESRLKVQLAKGFHVNSNTPSEAYLIPLRLTWEGKALEVVRVDFPKPVHEKYEFADKPLSVFTGDFEITTKFRTSAQAQPGMAIMSGKLRYQACTETTCYPPKTVPVKLTVSVR